MEPTKSTAVQLAWDLDLEKPTLGGALVLRQEGELLAEMRGQTGIQVFLSGRAIGDAVIKRLKKTVYLPSRYEFGFQYGRASDGIWGGSSHPDTDTNVFNKYFSEGHFLL